MQPSAARIEAPGLNRLASHGLRACGLVARVAALLGVVGSASAQTLPPSFTEPTVLPLTLVDLRTLPAVSATTQTRAQQALSADLRSSAVALTQKAGFDTNNSGTWEPVAGGQIWRLRVQSPGTLWMTAGFGTFRIPAGAMLWVYDPLQGQLQGPFDSTHVLEHGQRWTHPTDGDSLVVELFWPSSLLGLTPNLHLTRIETGFESLVPVGGGCGNECNPDVTCDQGFDVSVIKRGVVRLKIPISQFYQFACDGNTSQCDEQCQETGECWLANSAMCTGTLVNTTANDCQQYVLTAGHCSINPGYTASTSFLFNYEREPCCDGDPPDLFWVDNATLLEESDGTISDPEGLDMALIRIDDEIPLAYNARLNGWSRSEVPAQGFASCIHQPSGAKSKMIAWTLDGYAADGDRFWEVANWDVGAPRDGSSGSPLFNSGLRTVGWLSSGPNPPPCPGYGDHFGRMDRAWEITGIADWLDPADTGMLSYHGRDDGGLFSCNIAAYPFNPDPGPGGDGIPEPGETMTFSAPLENKGSTPLTNVAGVLRSTTPGVSIVVGQAAWPDIPGFDTRDNLPPHFGVHLDGDVACGSRLDFEMDITSDTGDGLWHPSFSMRVGQPGIATLPGFGSFTSSSLVGTHAWAPESTDETPLGQRWFIADVGSLTDTVLVTESIAALPPDARLAFRQRFDTENTYDGGLLEYTTDGTTWLDAAPLITRGGYLSGLPGGVPAEVRGRSAWAGDSDGWRDVELDLSTLAGQGLQFRFRFVTDVSGGDVGWWIDDAILEFTSYDCPPPPPPAVPEGSLGSPLRVEKLDPAGSDLRIFFDDSTCAGALDHHIVFGGGSQLPTAPTGSYGLSGAACGIGTTSPQDWIGSPDPAADPTRLVWFLLVANDANRTEGSWGLSSSGLERQGPDPAGASGQCGMLLKDTTNACGQ